VPFSRSRDDRGKADYFVASEDAGQLASTSGPLIEQAVGVQWYGTVGNDLDRAVLELCRLRRAGAGVGGGIERGDDAVRRVLEGVSPAALVWIASRTISYMDENGFPELVEPYLS
jgi:hypothetical protein